MEENLGSVILENNRIAVIRPDGTLEILVVSAGRTEPISISSFSPSDTQLLLDLLANGKAGQQSVHLTGLQSPRKCTTETLCPVHNVWHAKPPRR